jgi:hypothetical protein
LYELICFVLSVALIVTDKVSRRINDSLRQLGFDVVVAEPPPVVVDTIVKVAASVFVVQTAFYFVLTLLGVSYGQFSETTTFEISALNFLAYLFAMAAATATMKGAYHWRIRADMRLICAIAAYAATFWLNAIISLKLRLQAPSVENFLENPLPPLIFALNQAVLGYFTAIYVKKKFTAENNGANIEESNSKIDYRLALLQGILQSAPFLLAYIYRQIPSSAYNQRPIVILVAFAQALISGCLAGLLFQRWYCRSEQEMT